MRSTGRYVRPDRYKERPCPGCGAVAPLPEGKICETCTKKLADYERYKPQIELLAKRETSPVFIGERCWVPMGAKYVKIDFDDRDSDRGTQAAVYFGTAMRQLLLETCAHRQAKVKDGEWPNGLFHNGNEVARQLNFQRDDRPSKSGVFVEITEGAGKAIYSLYHAINLMLKEAEQQGRERGQNLLQQLASGEASVNSFDEHLDDIARVQRECREIAERRTPELTEKKRKGK